jgi:hypothetical protein
MTCIWGEFTRPKRECFAETLATVSVYPFQAGTASAWAGEVPSARLKAKTTSLAFGLNTGIHVGVGYLFPYMLNREEWVRCYPFT